MVRSMIIHGDALEELRKLEDNSVDAICADPPSSINFMGKEWDSDKGGRSQWVAWLSSIMAEALRVLKPGGHALVWSLPRTSHWTALALEDAGFEIRDSIYHLYGVDAKVSAFYATLSDEQRNLFTQILDSQSTPPNILALFGSGFPKSLDVSKAIDRMAGKEREVIGIKPGHEEFVGRTLPQPNSGWARPWRQDADAVARYHTATAPATPEAQQYAGFGTALKPAAECWWLCRKPLAEKSVAANVLKYGTGALNIDASRVGTSEIKEADRAQHSGFWQSGNGSGIRHAGSGTNHNLGRFPSHLLLSHTLLCTDAQCSEGCPVAALDEQSGISKSSDAIRRNSGFKPEYVGGTIKKAIQSTGFVDQGGASRYFATFRPDVPFVYSAKASRRERNEGCEALPAKAPSEWGSIQEYSSNPPATNHHPTVKAQQLMRYLVRLITPPGGTCLDMFGGSGSTAIACISEGMDYILIEKEQEYIDIIRARVAHAEAKAKMIA